MAQFKSIEPYHWPGWFITTLAGVYALIVTLTFTEPRPFRHLRKALGCQCLTGVKMSLELKSGWKIRLIVSLPCYYSLHISCWKAVLFPSKLVWIPLEYMESGNIQHLYTCSCLKVLGFPSSFMESGNIQHLYTCSCLKVLGFPSSFMESGNIHSIYIHVLVWRFSGFPVVSLAMVSQL